jgi:hypothetical protein
MDHFARLDVSVKETSICIVDDNRYSSSGGRCVNRLSSPPLAGHRARRRGMPAPNDDIRCRPRGGADPSRHRQRASPVPQIQKQSGRYLD